MKKINRYKAISRLLKLARRIDRDIIELQAISSQHPGCAAGTQYRLNTITIQCRISAMQLEDDTGKPSRIEAKPKGTSI